MVLNPIVDKEIKNMGLEFRGRHLNFESEGGKIRMLCPYRERQKCACRYRHEALSQLGDSISGTRASFVCVSHVSACAMCLLVQMRSASVKSFRCDPASMASNSLPSLFTCANVCSHWSPVLTPSLQLSAIQPSTEYPVLRSHQSATAMVCLEPVSQADSFRH